MRLVPEAASYTGLLGFLAVAMIVPNLFGFGPVAELAVELLFVVVMLASLWRLEPRRWVFALAVLSALVSELTQIGLVSETAPDSRWIVANHAASACFTAILLGAILSRVWATQAVRADTIVGGVVVYVMLGLTFAVVYQLLETAQPGSFVVDHAAGIWGAWEPEPGSFPRLFYFSFVTLTTVGYGDVSPGSQVAAALSALESVMGTLYLTILIARLVGLHIAGLREHTPQD